MSLTSKFQKAASLSTRDWLIMGEALWTLTAAHARLTFFPGRLEFHQKKTAGLQPANSARVARLVEVFGIAARNHPIAMNCLRRSVALRALLGRRGIETTLRIGVKKTGDDLAGHAWLEIDGKVLTDIPTISCEFLPLLAHTADQRQRLHEHLQPPKQK